MRWLIPALILAALCLTASLASPSRRRVGCDNNLHQQSQDPNPFPWPTPEQFEATVAWPGDETELRRRQGPRGPPEVEMKPRTIRTWQTCWISSCQESELYGQVAKFVICFIWTLLLLVILFFFYCNLQNTFESLKCMIY